MRAKVIRYGHSWHAWCEACRWVAVGVDTREEAEEIGERHEHEERIAS